MNFDRWLATAREFGKAHGVSFSKETARKAYNEGKTPIGFVCGLHADYAEMDLTN